MTTVVGNLIVIGVVLVILAVYRQLDRNNRSLEKVRRYADKVQVDLDGIVAQKAQELRDMSIEVDVHQKAAREVLKRIQSIEESLDTRAAQIDQIGSRINDYDGALDELVQMTRRVEENISRIKDESEYVDKVGKRLSASSHRMDEIEKAMNGLLDQFQKVNGARLEEMGNHLITAVRGRIEGLDDHISKTEGRVQKGLAEVEKRGQLVQQSMERRGDEVQQAVQASLSGYLERMRATEEDYAKRLDDAAAKGERLETVALQKVKEHIESKMKATSQELSASIADLRSRIEEFQEETGHRVDNYGVTVQERMDSIGEDVTRIETDIAERMKELDGEFARVEKETTSQLAEVQGQTREMTRAVEADLAREIKTRLAEATDELRRHVSQAQDDAESELARVAELQKQWDEQRMAVTAGIDSGSRELTARVAELQKQWDEQRKAVAAEIDRGSRDVTARVAELQKQWDEQRKVVIADINRGSQDLAARVAEFSDTFGKELEGKAEEIEQSVLSSVEQRLGSYEKGLDYRFEKLESLQTDIDALEGNLRESMGQMMERIEAEVGELGTRLQESRTGDLEKHEAEMTRIRAAMVQLEEGLDELKGRAYDNVSEKLKVFEDEFFADLRERSLSMESKLNDWQSRVQQTLDSMSAEASDERQRIETSYADELASALQELKTQVSGQFERLAQQVETFRVGVEERLGSADQTVQAIEERMASDIEQLQAQAGETFASRFSEFAGQVDGDLKELEKGVEGKMRELRDTVDSGHRDMEAALDSARSDVTVWQSQVMQQLKASESEVDGEFAGFRVQVSDTISSLRDEFERQKDDLIRETSDERTQLREEITVLSTRIQDLERDLELRTQTVLDTLASEYQQFQTEFQRKSRDVQTDADSKIREFRTFVHETREQFDQMQQSLFGKIDEDVRVLTVNLGEIDKRQKAFVEQTRIFERADTMRETLLQTIEEMKADLASIDTQRKELKGIEIEFVRLKKLGDDASDRLARFMGEKRRIDSIEEDYKRLIGLSQAVELKLQQVTSGNDTLAQMQIQMRGLEDMQKEVESRFQRLEKKRSVLDVTAEGVDKNFQYLEELEDKLDSLKGQLDSLPAHVDDLYTKIDRLSADRKDVDTAVKQLNGLEQILGDVEERMDNLQTAREWLARTETRLEEISRSAEEQVKLLGTIMKDDAKGARERGAPSLSARDTVVKLARQGWKVQEIAQATKLSRGEVELILEMSHK